MHLDIVTSKPNIKLIGHDNPQLFEAQIFDIAPLADFWAFTLPYLTCGVG